MARPRNDGQEIARKITIKEVTGGPEKWFTKLMAQATANKDDDTLDLMRVYGNAVKAEFGASDYGEFTKLHGQFRAINMDGGEITNASVCILPPHVAGAIAGALSGTPSVQFAFMVRVRFDAKQATKYLYVVNDLLPPSANDPMAALEASLGLSRQEQIEHVAQPPAPAPAATGKRK